MEYNFKMLAWDAGYTCHLSGKNQLDKAALCAFLHCSRRTLDRWIDESAPACPRAVAMLKMQAAALPATWRAVGARFTRYDELLFDDWRQPLALDVVQSLPHVRARANQLSGHLDFQSQYIKTIRDPAEYRKLKQELSNISEQLLRLANTPLISKRATG